MSINKGMDKKIWYMYQVEYYFPWRRKCNPLQYSCLENPTDRGAWWATVHRVTEGRTQLSD